MKVTYILLSFNQSKFIEETVLSALNQTYCDIEFIISDDCSSDDTFKIIEKIVQKYEFDKKIILNKNSNNLGLVRHFNKCLQMSSGDIIVLAGGDDIALEDRVERTVNYFASYTSVMVVSFNDFIFSDKKDKCKRISNISEDKFYAINDMFKIPVFSGASRAFRREVYETFGLLSDNAQTEDTTFLLRSLLCGKALLSASPGIFYRWHGENMSNKKNIKKLNSDNIFNQYTTDILKAFELGLINDEMQSSLFRRMRFQKKIRKFYFEDNFVKKFCLGIILFFSEKYFREKVFVKLKKHVVRS